MMSMSTIAYGALREAQLAMKQRYPDPLYWGAFICQGNPDELPRHNLGLQL
jgi:CHAT domain-containing protein